MLQYISILLALFAGTPRVTDGFSSQQTRTASLRWPKSAQTQLRAKKDDLIWKGDNVTRG